VSYELLPEEDRSRRQTSPTEFNSEAHSEGGARPKDVFTGWYGTHTKGGEARKTNVILQFVKEWGWFVFSAVVALAFTTGMFKGTSEEKISGLEAFRTEQRTVNERTEKQLSDLNNNVVKIDTKLDDYFHRNP